MQSKWRFSHAQGYLSLGLIAEAAAELEHIPAPERDQPSVLALRIVVLQERGEWPATRALAAEFVRRAPAESGGWLSWAYATRRVESIAAAEKILLEAERLHPKEPAIQFNLGCYASQRGALAEARRRVDRAIALDQTFAARAATDPDLEPLRSAGPPSSSRP